MTMSQCVFCFASYNRHRCLPVFAASFVHLFIMRIRRLHDCTVVYGRLYSFVRVHERETFLVFAQWSASFLSRKRKLGVPCLILGSHVSTAIRWLRVLFDNLPCCPSDGALWTNCSKLLKCSKLVPMQSANQSVGR